MASNEQVLKVLIYRANRSGITCTDCPESVKSNLLSTSTSHKFDVKFIGPDDDDDVSFDTPDVFKDAAVFIVPGGPNHGPAWQALKKQNDVVRDFVANGGRYIGICLGAFLAGPDQGFNLLPAGDTVLEEAYQPGSQVSNLDNAVIQVDWNYQTGVNQSQTANGQWAFFQDGATFTLPNMTDLNVLGRYSSNGNASAVLSQFGQGWVGLTGFHLDADRSWYLNPTVVNPSGVQFDIGHDFINATLNGATPNSTFVSNVPYTNATSTSPTSSSPSPTSTASAAGPSLQSVSNLTAVLFLIASIHTFLSRHW